MVLHENDIAARMADRPPRVEDVHVNGVPVRVLESCHSLWVFEPERGRFRRVPRGTRLDMPSAENEWTPYYRLELDASSGAFSVGLNPDDTRVLRSWIHADPCRHCSSDQTGELTVEALRRTLDGAGGAA
ncbi:MAG TPA: hypothetical protein VF180_02540 [Acidimicrobiia bacterium]